MKNIKFPNKALYKPIEQQYKDSVSTEEMVELFFEWMGLSEKLKPEFSEPYYVSACVLYSELTGYSYESKTMSIN